jgi:hypothetical protein
MLPSGTDEHIGHVRKSMQQALVLRFTKAERFATVHVAALFPASSFRTKIGIKGAVEHRAVNDIDKWTSEPVKKTLFLVSSPRGCCRRSFC